MVVRELQAMAWRGEGEVTAECRLRWCDECDLRCCSYCWCWCNDSVSDLWHGDVLRSALRWPCGMCECDIWLSLSVVAHGGCFVRWLSSSWSLVVGGSGRGKRGVGGDIHPLWPRNGLVQLSRRLDHSTTNEYRQSCIILCSVGYRLIGPIMSLSLYSSKT